MEGLLELARLFAAGANPVAKVVGSAAFSLHLAPDRFRLPNDLDLVWLSDPAEADVVLMDRIERASVWSLAGQPHSTKLRSGDRVATEYRLERRAPDLVDRLTLQHCERWPDRADLDRITTDGFSYTVEPFSWSAFHKLDAIFKPRTPGWVSSRCRDLFDLALGFDAGAPWDPGTISARVMSLGCRWVLEPEPPAEWAAAWGKLTDASGFFDLRLDVAWRAARQLAARALEGALA